MTQPAAQSVSDADLLAALKQVFGFHSFRPNQQEIVQAVLAGRDVFAVMPTGGGKSLCYQLPAHLLAGTAVVISPLISLMKDQVDAARANGLRAEFINSSLDASDRSEVFRRLHEHELDLLYVAPERFAMEPFLAGLKNLPLSLFAIDEAHCISEWGHDFRPDYLSLSQIVREFPHVPVAAFTATATHRVQQDIIRRLGLRDPFGIRASFDRPNLFYQVLPKADIEGQILSFVQWRPTESGIVYRTTRRSVEETAAFLAAAGVKCLPYHAGLNPDLRRRTQDAFNRDKINVIVATIAFGMGIDKSNVRFVIHGDLPKNIESYYQETGRSGRDGEPAHCLLFYSYADTSRLHYFIDKMTDATERRVAEAKLNEMVNYASIEVCRRRGILGYFGEAYPGDNCAGCDVCSGDVQRTDASIDAQKIMSAIARIGERYGAAYVVEIVTGADSERVRARGHDKLKTFGVGRDQDKRHWRRIIDNLIAQQCLAPSEDEYRVLRLTEKGRDVLFGRKKFFVLRQKESPVGPRRRKEAPAGRKRRGRRVGADGAAEAAPLDYNVDLFERLRAVRRRLAQERNVPPFVIFSDRTLREMAAYFPANEIDLRSITGVGEQKLEQFGAEFLGEIKSFLAERGRR